MSSFMIIDGSSMLSTSYYGNLPKSILFEKDVEVQKQHYGEILHTSDGRYTNAIFTMFRTMLAMYKKTKPDYIAFVFDKSRNTFRRTQLGADFYKANRKATPEPLKEQFIAMEEILEKIGFKVLIHDDYEADDFAASLVRKFANEEVNTYVVTKDHDYFQLVGEHTRMWRIVDRKKREQLSKMYGNFASKEHYDEIPSNVFEYTVPIVYSEEGVYPKDIVKLLAIQGDPGDGIPGCKGVSSAAAPLINEYGSLEAIYKAIDDCNGDAKLEKALATEWKALGIKQNPINKLKAGRDDVFLSEKLAQMKEDIEISESLNDFAFMVNVDNLMEVLDDYELASIKTQVEEMN